MARLLEDAAERLRDWAQPPARQRPLRFPTAYECMMEEMQADLLRRRAEDIAFTIGQEWPRMIRVRDDGAPPFVELRPTQYKGPRSWVD